MAKKLTIDGKEITARDDTTIIQAAHEAGVLREGSALHPAWYCHSALLLSPQIEHRWQLPYVSRRVGGTPQAGN